MSPQTSRVKMTHRQGERPRNVVGDFDWVHHHEKELLEKYGEQSIIVYKEQVIGVGETYALAVEDAERNLPPDVTEVTPVHVMLERRNPFVRARPTSIREKPTV